jgi:hypothetical protein
MTVESLCIAIAEERVLDGALKKQLVDPSFDCRKKINSLNIYFRIKRTASLLHRVLDMRRDYIHLHKTELIPEEILTCVNLLHLALISEYGLVTVDNGKVKFAGEDYIGRLAKEMGVSL